MTDIERNPDGTFKKGGPSPNPAGRPPKEKSFDEILQLARRSITERDWLVIFNKAKDDAMGADDSAARERARRFLAEYLFGRPGTAGAGPRPETIYDEYTRLSNEDLRSLLIELLAQEVAARSAAESASDAEPEPEQPSPPASGGD